MLRIVLLEVKLRIDNQLFLVNLVACMILPQRVVPLSGIQWQVVQQDAPHQRPQPLDLIGDALESQLFQLLSVDFLVGPGQTV